VIGCGCPGTILGYSSGYHPGKPTAYASAKKDAQATPLEKGCTLGHVIPDLSKCVMWGKESK
jgi:hypothetical protein